MGLCLHTEGEIQDNKQNIYIISSVGQPWKRNHLLTAVTGFIPATAETKR